MSPQELTAAVLPRARSMIPEFVQSEMLSEIRKFLEINLK